MKAIRLNFSQSILKMFQQSCFVIPSNNFFVHPLYA